MTDLNALTRSEREEIFLERLTWDLPLSYSYGTDQDTIDLGYSTCDWLDEVNGDIEQLLYEAVVVGGWDDEQMDVLTSSMALSPLLCPDWFPAFQAFFRG
jgi:hypothetical protein